MNNILAALARESLLSERVISMEADGATTKLPAINPSLPQNVTPASDPNKEAAPTDKAAPTEADDTPDAPAPAADIKRLLVEAGYFGVCALKSAMESLAAQGDYVQSEYGDDKAKRVTEMVQALQEMKTMLSEMYNASGDESVQAPAQNAAPSQPVDTAGQGAPAPQAIPPMDAKEQPEV